MNEGEVSFIFHAGRRTGGTVSVSSEIMVIQLEKVLISDDVDPKCVDILQSNSIQVVQNTTLTKEQLIAEIPVCVFFFGFVLFCLTSKSCHRAQSRLLVRRIVELQIYGHRR